MKSKAVSSPQGQLALPSTTHLQRSRRRTWERQQAWTSSTRGKSRSDFGECRTQQPLLTCLQRPERERRERQEQQGQRQGQRNRFSSTDGENRSKFGECGIQQAVSSTRLKTKRVSVTLFREDTVHRILALQDEITDEKDAAKPTFRMSRAAASTML